MLYNYEIILYNTWQTIKKLIVFFFLNQFSNFQGEETENHNPAIEFNHEYVEGFGNIININLRGGS